MTLVTVVKLSPSMTTFTPAPPSVGAKSVTIGAVLLMKFELVVKLPCGEVTVIGPVPDAFVMVT